MEIFQQEAAEQGEAIKKATSRPSAWKWRKWTGLLAVHLEWSAYPVGKARLAANGTNWNRSKLSADALSCALH